MKKVLLALLLIGTTHLTRGATLPHLNQSLWYPGQVTLADQNVVVGEINYDLKYNAIQVRRHGVVRTYTAEKIAHFTLFDQAKHRERHYVAIDHQLTEGYQRKTFFEVLTEGDLTILRKSKYIRRPRVTEDQRAPHIYLNAVCRHAYYAYNQGEFFEIDDFTEQVLPLMTDYEDLVQDYIRQCKLKLRKISEQMRVVHLYNQLRSQQANKGAVTEALK
jgi:hypothetical protein